ncbi:hypothetical protein WEI85_06705 [Actinomycetes bacterium KLBMP 9797]
MKTRIYRRVGRAACLSLLASAALAGVNPPAGHAAVTTDQPATDTQVAVTTVDPADGVGQLSASLAAALETAEVRTAEDPTNLAPPYVARATGRIVAPVTSVADATKVAYAAGAIAVDTSTLPDEGGDDETTAGTVEGKDEEAAAAAPATAGEPAAEAAFPTFYYPSTPVVKYSKSALTAVKGDVLNSGVPGVEHMWAAFIDAETNRVLVKTSTVTEEMRTALASRYAADQLALLLTDEQQPELLSRPSDTSPFWGGSYAVTSTGGSTRWHCTIGFPWSYNGADYYITAGHCTGLNTYTWMPRYGTDIVGVVRKDGWNNNTGSVKIDGQSYNTGDVALVQLFYPYKSGYSIYVGGPRSNVSRTIGGVATKSPKKGDKVCSGGSTVGELCGWKVTDGSTDVRFRDGTLARNVAYATKTPTCAAEGDSGGPIYSIRSNGSVTARGILSGGGFNGSKCSLIFSDIRVAEKSFPGAVKHS